MKKEVKMLEKLLSCAECGRNNLNYTNTHYSNETKYSGSITCENCKQNWNFMNGVLDFSRDSFNDYNAIDKRNMPVFFDTWKLASADYNNSTYDTEYEIYKKHSNLVTNAIILDAGCGSGRTFEEIAKYGPKMAILLDIGDSIYLAQKRICGKNNFPILFIKTNLNKIPLQNQSIELSFSNGVLHHVANQSQALKEIFRVSRKDVLLGIVTETTFIGRVWIRGNSFRKLLNRFYLPRTFYFLSLVLSKIVLFMMWTFCKLYKNGKTSEFFGKVVSDPLRHNKMHYQMLDYLTAPYYDKNPDAFYEEIAHSMKYKLVGKEFSNQAVFFTWQYSDAEIR